MAAPSVESHRKRSQAARVSRVDHRASLQADGHSVGCRTLKARLTHLRERCPCSHSSHVMKQLRSTDLCYSWCSRVPGSGTGPRANGAAHCGLHSVQRGVLPGMDGADRGKASSLALTAGFPRGTQCFTQCLPLPHILGIAAAAHESVISSPGPHHGEQAVERLEGCSIHGPGEIPGPA